MGEDASDIRTQIEETRERVGDEVDALSYKTDIGARASDFVDDTKAAVKAKVTGAKDMLTGGAGDATQAVADGAAKVVPSRQQLGRLRRLAEHNPIGLAAGGLATGILVGMLLPSTQLEDEHLGELSDRVVDTAKETAGEALARGKQVAQEAAQAATETAKESGRDQAEELGSTLRARVESTEATAGG
jgi:hypothetical protein